MSEQIQRNRMELVLALRSERYEQCQGGYVKGDSVCWAGLGMKLFNILPEAKINNLPFKLLIEALDMDWNEASVFVKLNDKSVLSRFIRSF